MELDWRLEAKRLLLPVQAVDHVSHSVDEILVLLGVTDDDAVELLHVGVDGVQGGRLAAGCGDNKHSERLRSCFTSTFYKLLLYKHSIYLHLHSAYPFIYICLCSHLHSVHSVVYLNPLSLLFHSILQSSFQILIIKLCFCTDLVPSHVNLATT